VIETLEKYYEDGLLHRQVHPTLDLTIWNYSPKVQYEKLWDEVTIQCRGLVTNSKGKIVARPFKKFFNYEEHTPEEIPNEEYEVYEKMDGSLGILFNYDGEWVIATRGSFTSPQSIKAKELLEKYNFNRLIPQYTYLFEIIYHENRIVCQYDFEDLVLLGIIETKTGNEVNIHFGNDEDIRFKNLINNLGFKVVTLYKTWGESYDLLKEEISKDKEGYVIRFRNGFRMKIKGDEYVRLHKILTNISNRDIWEYLKDNRPLDDILDKVPDEFYDWVKNEVSKLTSMFNITKTMAELIHLKEIKENMTRKEMAEVVLKKPKEIQSILFALIDNKDITGLIWKRLYPEYSKPFKKND